MTLTIKENFPVVQFESIIFHFGLLKILWIIGFFEPDAFRGGWMGCGLVCHVTLTYRLFILRKNLLRCLIAYSDVRFFLLKVLWITLGNGKSSFQFNSYMFYLGSWQILKLCDLCSEFWILHRRTWNVLPKGCVVPISIQFLLLRMFRTDSNTMGYCFLRIVGRKLDRLSLVV